MGNADGEQMDSKKRWSDSDQKQEPHFNPAGCHY